MILTPFSVFVFFIYLTKAEPAIDIAVSLTNYWIFKWINFVPVVMREAEYVALTDQMQSKFFVWTDYYSPLEKQEGRLKYFYKVNSDSDNASLVVTLKNRYPTDLTYAPAIDLQDRCLSNENFKVVNEKVVREEYDFHIFLLVTCDPKPAIGQVNTKKAKTEIKEASNNVII